MGFWTPEYGDSLEKMGKVDEANRENGDKYKFVEVDITRKKGWAKKFGIEVSAEKTARVIELQAGKLVRELDLAADLRGQM